MMLDVQVETLGILEFSDTVSGIRALDAIVKAAPVEILKAAQINPGKMVLFFCGDVASVEIAIDAGVEVSTAELGLIDGTADRGPLIETTFLPRVHQSVADALRGRTIPHDVYESIGVIDCTSIAGAVYAADAATKEAQVIVTEIRIGDSMGGRASLRLTGELHELESAMDTARDYLSPRGQLISSVTIANPHSDVVMNLGDGSNSNDDR